MKIENTEIYFLGHSGFLIISANGKKIVIDPFNISEKVPKADIILITHGHYDHCSIKDIKKISQKGTIIVIPADAQSKITKIDDIEMQLVEPGDELTINNIKIETFPAYNINKKYHDKNDFFLSYVIKDKEVVIYHAGDTDKIPEMEKLTGYGKQGNKFIILLPVSGKYVMNPEEAAEVAELLKPLLAIPMHYGAGVVGTIKEAEEFVKLCEKKNISAKILEKF